MPKFRRRAGLAFFLCCSALTLAVSLRPYVDIGPNQAEAGTEARLATAAQPSVSLPAPPVVRISLLSPAPEQPALPLALHLRAPETNGFTRFLEMANAPVRTVRPVGRPDPDSDWSRRLPPTP